MKTIIFTLLLLFPQAIWAQNVLPIRQFGEILRTNNNIPVSGDVRLGVQSGKLDERVLESFELTPQSLKHLENENIPDIILNNLRLLQDQEFITEDDFLNAVRQQIGEEHTGWYREQILNYAVSLNLPTVFLPQRNLRKLCVRIKSIDGRYEADMEYDIHNIPLGEKYRLEYPTEYPEALNSYNSKELAIYAEVKDVCEGGTQDIVIASWEPDSQLKEITILLNTDRNYIVKLKVPALKGEAHIKMCHRINTEQATIKTKKIPITYNFECVLPIEKNKYDYSKSTIHIRKDFMFLEPIILPLALP